MLYITLQLKCVETVRARTVRSTGVASNTRCPLMSSTPLRSKAQFLRLRRQPRALLGPIFRRLHKAHATGATTGRPTRSISTLLSRMQCSYTDRAIHPVPSMRMLWRKVATISQREQFLEAMADIIAATDGLAIYRAWLESQVEVQKAKIQAMSKQYSIPIPQLDLDPLDFPPLGMIPPTMANTLPSTAITATRDLRGQQSEVQPTPQAPRLEPAQAFPRAPTHVPKSAPTTNRYCHEHEVPISATPPGGIAISTHEKPDSSTAAPRKIDMSYKTTPCRHFTLNRGWCPWGDDCCL